MAVRNVEADLAKLTLLGEAPAAEALPGLRKALADRVNVVVAKAARIAAERRMGELIPDLLRALDRMFEKGVDRDPQCWGKSAIAKALVDLQYRESAPFVRGVAYRQLEPTWGKLEDTAFTFRGTCVLALAVCGDIAPEKILRCLVDALADAAGPVRLEAVRALAQLDAALILRLKANVGDEEANILGEVFDSLLQLEPDEALPFVGRFLQSEKEVIREEAALAMGASRLPAAVPLLREAWDAQNEQVMLRALSASRQEEAITFLLGLLRDGRQRDREAALEALSIHKESPEIWSRVQEAAGPVTPAY